MIWCVLSGPGKNPVGWKRGWSLIQKNTVISNEINTLFLQLIQNVMDDCRQFTPFVHQIKQLDTKSEKSVCHILVKMK